MPAWSVTEQARAVSHQVTLLHLHVSLRTLPGHSRFSCPQWHCLAPAVRQCWLCPVTKVYLECCKSTPTQAHPQPVPRAQLKGFDLTLFYKIVTAAPPLHATATAMDPPGLLQANIRVARATAQGSLPIYFQGLSGLRTVAVGVLRPHNLETAGSEHRKGSSESHSSQLVSLSVLEQDILYIARHVLPGKGLWFYMGQSSAEQAFPGSKHSLRTLCLGYCTGSPEEPS